jgi:hypothetical protein
MVLYFDGRLRMSGTLFEPGIVLVTQGASAALCEYGLHVDTLLARHLQGDWGDVVGEAVTANQRALLTGGELGSTFSLPNRTECLILTAGDRSLTCILTDAELPVVLSVTPEKRSAALQAEAGARPHIERTARMSDEARTREESRRLPAS